MSFFKRLLKTSERRTKHSKSSSGGERGTDSRSPSHSRSNSPSPAPSPRHTAGVTVTTAGVTVTTAGVTVTTVGVRSPSNRYVAQVLPGLLLGSQEFAQDLNALERYKVTHILNVTEEVNCPYPAKFAYKRISIPDRPSTNIQQYFEECFAYIDTVRQSKGCVLVHCYYGESRSASIVIGYLIKTERMRYCEALEYLQMLRPGVHPNVGFTKQLEAYETATNTPSQHHQHHQHHHQHHRSSSGSSSSAT